MKWFLVWWQCQFSRNTLAGLPRRLQGATFPTRAAYALRVFASWWRKPWFSRIQVALLALAALLTHALWPSVAWAGCGVTDFSACADDAQYTVWYGAATFLWAIDAMLLQLAYLVDVFRVWVIETAFTP